MVPTRFFRQLSVPSLASVGLAEVHDERLVCTMDGRAFNNDVASIFATDTARRTHHPQALDYMRAGT